MSNNLALNKSASASSYVKPFQPSRAVDGNNRPEFRWICNSLPGWLKVDLGGEYYIDRWVVTHMGAAGWDSRYNVSDYIFQGSLDNANWIILDSVTGNSSSSTDRKIAIVKVRYVRVSVTRGIAINPQLASIVELQVYEAESSSSALSTLVTTPGTLTPTFNKTVLNYTSNVGYDATSITVTPTTEDLNATAKVNDVVVPRGQASQPIALDAPGDHNIDILVTPAFGPKTTTYKVNALRASSPYLESLVTPAIALTPAFNSNTYSYTNTTSKVSATLIPTAVDSNATITINGEVVQSGTAKIVNLDKGLNTIIIKVASKIGVDQREYTLSITRL